MLSLLFFIKKHQFDLKNYIIYFYLSYFILQQGILEKLLDLLNCENYKFDLVNEKSYLKNYLGIECFDNNHFKWIIFMIIPGLSLYALIVPLSTILFFYLKKSDFTSKINIIKYDFLMRQPFFYKSSLW